MNFDGISINNKLYYDDDDDDIYIYIYVHIRGKKEIQTSNFCFIRRNPNQLSYILGTIIR